MLQRAPAPDGKSNRKAPSSAHGTGQNRTAAATIRQGIKSAAQPLPPSALAFMEPRFRHDLSRVRVHAGPEAAESAAAAGARAYTIGPDIVFGAGHYAPHTPAGRHLLAHELTHAVQQNFALIGEADETLRDSNSAAETEAARAAEAVSAGHSFSPALRSAPGVARAPAAGGDGVSFVERESTPYREAIYDSYEHDAKGLKSFTGEENYLLIRRPASVEVEVRIRLVSAENPQKDYMPNASLPDEWLFGIRQIWNNRFRFTNGKTSLPLVFNPRIVKGNAHFKVLVHPGAAKKGDPTNEDNWHEDDDPFTGIPHEFGHMLGNPDEYNVPGKTTEISRTTGMTEAEKRRSSWEGITGQPRPRRQGGYDKKNVMGTGGQAFRRHVSKILAFFNDNLRQPKEPRFHTEYMK